MLGVEDVRSHWPCFDVGKVEQRERTVYFWTANSGAIEGDDKEAHAGLHRSDPRQAAMGGLLVLILNISDPQF